MALHYLTILSHHYALGNKHVIMVGGIFYDALGLSPTDFDNRNDLGFRFELFILDCINMIVCGSNGITQRS